MKYVFWITVVLGAVFVAYQFVAPELANIEFQDDLHDLSTQMSSRIGLTSPRSDEELRQIIIRKAEKYDIMLEPKQVTVKRGGTDQAPVFFLAVDYTVTINLPGYTVILHYSPTSAGGRF